MTLLFAGFFKPLSAVQLLPIDLTLLAAVVVSLMVVAQLTQERGRTRIPAAVLPVAAIVTVGSIPEARGSFGADARLGLALVILAVVGVGTLINTEERQRMWIWAHVGVGFLLVLVAQNEGAAGRRLELVGGNSIAAGQAAGVAAVVLMVLLMTNGIGSWAGRAAAAVTILAMATALLGTGARGPVLSAGVSIVVVAFLVPKRGRVLRLWLALAAIYASAEILTRASNEGASRLRLALSGRIDNTESRRPLWDAAVAYSSDHFFGVGWGNFYQVSGAHFGGTIREYPHNVILEATVEGGWIAGLLLVVFLGVGLWHLRRNADHPSGAALFGIGVFFATSSMVSGSIADNRAMFAAVAMGFVVRRSDSRPTATLEDTPPMPASSRQ